MAAAEDVLGLVGTTIDQVRFDACVDSGGFGLVYRGVHLGMDEPVAIKCLRIAGGRPDPGLRETIAARFRDETKLLYRLSQGNLDIVRCIGGGILSAPSNGEPTPYMILEWLEGKTLHVDLRERRDANMPGRTLDETIALLDSAVNALAYAHAQAVIHRDIKPGNLYLVRTREGGVRMKVLDFGLAKILDDDSLGMRPTASTQQGTHFCSPSYGAPEQYSKSIGAIGPWTDVYALALVVLEVLTGNRVRPAGSLAEGLVKAINPKTASPTASSLGLRLPSAVEALLSRAVSLNPLERPADAGAFWSALKEVSSTAKKTSDLASTVADANVEAAMAHVQAAQANAARRSFGGTMLMGQGPTAAQMMSAPPPAPAPAAAAAPARAPAPAPAPAHAPARALAPAPAKPSAGALVLVFVLLAIALATFAVGAFLFLRMRHR